MIKKEIKIAGKKVKMAYCIATEIMYRDYTGEDFQDFVIEIAKNSASQKTVNAKKTIYAILSSILSFYQSKDEEPPIKDTDLMFDAKPAEIITALSTVVELRNDWYKVPDGEPKEKKGTGSKN